MPVVLVHFWTAGHKRIGQSVALRESAAAMALEHRRDERLLLVYVRGRKREGEEIGGGSRGGVGRVRGRRM